MSHSTILIVEDDAGLREALNDTLKLADYRVIAAASAENALIQLAAEKVDLVVSDIQMGDMNGLTLLKNIKARYPQLPVLLMTAYATIDDAVQAMRDGATDYLSKPFAPEVLLNLVSRYAPAHKIESRTPIAADPGSLRLLELSRKVAGSDATVMVLGPSGSGKEVLSRYIHDQSSRAAEAFVAINCAAMPESLIEAELFGYEEGAFTGGRKKGSPGLIRQADGGVLFLDEIGDMPLNLQCRLLRVLQEREVMPLGGGKPRPVDFHLICATRQALPEAIEDGRFRSDLYYRIAQYVLALPPLREHPDRHCLISQLWDQIHGEADEALEEDVQARLAGYEWPGNYRQITAVLQQLSILRRSGIQPGVQDLPEDVRRAESGQTAPDDLRSQSDEAIRQAVDAAGGNVSLAARRLGVNRSTIYRRIRAH